jgi:hypothetical protein
MLKRKDLWRWRGTRCRGHHDAVSDHDATVGGGYVRSYGVRDTYDGVTGSGCRRRAALTLEGGGDMV